MTFLSRRCQLGGRGDDGGRIRGARCRCPIRCGGTTWGCRRASFRFDVGGLRAIVAKTRLHSSCGHRKCLIFEHGNATNLSSTIVKETFFKSTRPPYPEQESEELGDEVIARLNPKTGEIENLQCSFLNSFLRSDLFELPSQLSYVGRGKPSIERSAIFPFKFDSFDALAKHLHRPLAWFPPQSYPDG